MRSVSEYLFARPSFIEGIARIFDIGGTLNEYNVSATEADADALAFAMDVAAVGEDFRYAVSAVGQEIESGDKE